MVLLEFFEQEYELLSSSSLERNLKLDGGTLMNQCIHNIDLLQWCLGGEVETLYSQCDTFIRDIEGEDFGAVLVRFKNGAIGIIEGSACVYPKNLEETLSILEKMVPL